MRERAKAKLGSTMALLFCAVVSGGCGGPARGARPATLQQAGELTPLGARVYKQRCLACHGRQGEGLGSAPAVLGPTALPLQGMKGDHGPFRTAQDVFDYTKANMPLPRNRIGTLTDEQYWAVVTYMLLTKGVAMPEEGLSPETASSVVVNPG